MSHAVRGSFEPCMIVPVLTEKWRLQSRQRCGMGLPLGMRSVRSDLQWGQMGVVPQRQCSRSVVAAASGSVVFGIIPRYHAGVVLCK